MGNEDKLKAMLTASRSYYSYLEEYSKLWSQTSVKTREKERDLLNLSDQLRCLSMPNETNLSETEIRKTFDRVMLIMEEKFTVCLTMLETVLKKQEELTNLRMSVEYLYQHFEDSDISQRLMKITYVSWVLLQTRSSSTSAAIRKLDYKSPETIRHLLQCISGSDDLAIELKDTLEIAENLMLALDLSIKCTSHSSLV